jgi:hypothetical protein
LITTAAGIRSGGNPSLRWISLPVHYSARAMEGRRYLTSAVFFTLRGLVLPCVPRNIFPLKVRRSPLPMNILPVKEYGVLKHYQTSCAEADLPETSKITFCSASCLLIESKMILPYHGTV